MHWSDCAYAQAGLSLCWSHIPHCWKSYVASHYQHNLTNLSFLPEETLVLSLPVESHRRLWSDCEDVQAGLSLCWSHIPHCWKSHVAAHYLHNLTNLSFLPEETLVLSLPVESHGKLWSDCEDAQDDPSLPWVYSLTSIFCWTFAKLSNFVHSSIAIILMGKRELVA